MLLPPSIIAARGETTSDPTKKIKETLRYVVGITIKRVELIIIAY